MNPIPQKLDDYCKRNKIILSERKKEVLFALMASEDQVEAEDLYFRIISKSRSKISMASVYVALNWLVDLGFAEKVKNKRANLFKIANLELADS